MSPNGEFGDVHFFVQLNLDSLVWQKFLPMSYARVNEYRSKPTWKLEFTFPGVEIKIFEQDNVIQLSDNNVPFG